MLSKIPFIVTFDRSIRNGQERGCVHEGEEEREKARMRMPAPNRYTASVRHRTWLVLSVTIATNGWVLLDCSEPDVDRTHARKRRLSLLWHRSRTLHHHLCTHPLGMRTITPGRERQAIGNTLPCAKHNGAESSDNDLAYGGNSTGVVCTGMGGAGGCLPVHSHPPWKAHASSVFPSPIPLVRPSMTPALFPLSLLLCHSALYRCFNQNLFYFLLSFCFFCIYFWNLDKSALWIV